MQEKERENPLCMRIVVKTVSDFYRAPERGASGKPHAEPDAVVYAEIAANRNLYSIFEHSPEHWISGTLSNQARGLFTQRQ